MDTSETYIKMCEKAEEIQGQRKDNQSHQFFCCRICGEIASEDTGSYWVDCDCTRTNTELIWLPSQDQLQEMVKEEYGYDWYLAWLFGAWCSDLGEDRETKSMEQLWLAFVVKEKYNKVWNGEDWT